MSNAQDVEDIEDIYNINEPNIYIGSNNDRYLIYEERSNKIDRADLAIAGAIHSKKAEENEEMNSELNEEIGEETIEGNKATKGASKLAVAESAEVLYNLLIKAGKEGKGIYCDATKDTSLINIKRMLKKGLVRTYSNDGREIIYDKEKGLVYKDNEEVVDYNYYSDSEEIEMLSMQIEPEIEKLEQEEKHVAELLKRLKEIERLKGKEKEEGLEELRKQIRSGGESYDER